MYSRKGVQQKLNTNSQTLDQFPRPHRSPVGIHRGKAGRREIHVTNDYLITLDFRLRGYFFVISRDLV